ncbi:MAG: adenylate/guanylate cyclase domain-containing protein [Actinomycetota bacterium]|nr:adenylate/guanylate cyclase domain-containing protein [Actinomycetota bacterium]MDQ3954459.1 adenylate/guanylate cyclase domain-containing protein [Actinomycetota bacterium]
MAKRVQYPFHSLEDFLTSRALHVDGQLNDGWGAEFPVKGREIYATVLFADITAFSERTRDLTPAETLIFVNNFFAWISAETIRGTPGIVDKYIGDEVMVVYSEEFGSKDPFADAVRAARWMAQNDALGFSPHIGIASGRVIVGYAGTPLKYNCSVFGAPMAIAARCAAVKVQREHPYGAVVVFPATDWGDRDLREVIPPQHCEGRDGEIVELPYDWELSDPREEIVKTTTLQIRELVKTGIWLPYPGSGPEDRARRGLSDLRRSGLYRPDLAD